ncbi:MAG: thiamine phosphate synthase [Holophagales bacterium]|nr:thiamine phosphate synthase [Holophagales bacterium]MYG31933.1 thiamine phosphate synthase [Holophagales bacterium]MYI79004.1 thiamine phosphate synthase [Holophagales bacterium]
MVERVRGRRGIPPLLAISARQLCGGAGGLGSWARSLPTGTAIQLREKDLERADLIDLGRALRSAFDGVLIVNGDLEAALACDADGVHLPSDAPWREVGARVRQRGLLLGVSTHSLEELAAASEAGAHYAMFGPVFDSPEKRRFGPPQGLERLRRAARVGPPVLAVGGVDAGNAPAIARAGAHGVAAIRAFVDPRTAADLETAWIGAAGTMPRCEAK